MSTPTVDLPIGDYGPDTTSTPPDDTLPPVDDPPKNAKKPPRATPFSGLGKNTRTRSSIRQLNADDREKAVKWYGTIANLVAFVHPQLADAIDQNKEDCVDAWFELAEKNDRVRQAILASIEGGAWGRVIMTHAPLFMAVLPPQFLERVLMAQFQRFAQPPPEDAEPAPQYPADMYNGAYQPGVQQG